MAPWTLFNSEKCLHGHWIKKLSPWTLVIPIAISITTLSMDIANTMFSTFCSAWPNPLVDILIIYMHHPVFITYDTKSFCLSVFVSFWLSICHSVCACVHLYMSFHLSAVHHSFFMFTCLLIWLSFLRPSLHLFVHPCVNTFVRLDLHRVPLNMFFLNFLQRKLKMLVPTPPTTPYILGDRDKKF